MDDKPIHAKPALYTHFYEIMKAIAKKHGYCLLLHGSMNRDLDLVAVPWDVKVKPHLKMSMALADAVGGVLAPHRFDKESDRYVYHTVRQHGRIGYVIQLNRGGLNPKLQFMMDSPKIRGRWRNHDPQYYIDLSVMPTEDDWLAAGVKKE